MSKPQFVMQKLKSSNDIVQHEYTPLSATHRVAAIKEALSNLDSNETFHLLTKMEERDNKARYIAIDIITKIDDKHYHDELPKYVSIWLWA